VLRDKELQELLGLPFDMLLGTSSLAEIQSLGRTSCSPNLSMPCARWGWTGHEEAG
jgi:hypothetical protein